MDNTNIITLRKSMSFTEKHLDVAKKHLDHRMKTFPNLFNNVEFKTLKIKDMIIVDADLLDRNVLGEGSSQGPRATQTNTEYNQLKTNMLEIGYKIYEKPIIVRHIGQGGYFDFVDGRTKDKILCEMGVKNRIVLVVEIDDSEHQVYGNRWNAPEDVSPAGYITSDDVMKLCNDYISKGYIENEHKQIEELINKACGTGKFTYKTRAIMASNVYKHWNSVLTGALEPRAFRKSSEVKIWLQKNKYIETDTVKYLPYSSEAPVKAVIAAANESKLNPNKEIRVVVYLPYFKTYDSKKSYISAMTDFKNIWHTTISSLSSSYFGNATTKNSKIVLYAYMPANIEGVCEDMTKLVVIGKNDQNVDMDFYNAQKTNSSLSNFFEIDNEEDDKDLMEI